MAEELSDSNVQEQVIDAILRIPLREGDRRTVLAAINQALGNPTDTISHEGGAMDGEAFFRRLCHLPIQLITLIQAAEEGKLPPEALERIQLLLEEFMLVEIPPPTWSDQLSAGEKLDLHSEAIDMEKETGRPRAECYAELGRQASKKKSPADVKARTDEYFKRARHLD